MQAKSMLGSIGIESFYANDSINDVLYDPQYVWKRAEILFGVEFFSVSLPKQEVHGVFMNESYLIRARTQFVRI